MAGDDEPSVDRGRCGVAEDAGLESPEEFQVVSQFEIPRLSKKVPLNTAGLVVRLAVACWGLL